MMKLDGNAYASASVAGSPVYVDLEGRAAPITVSIYPPSGGATAALVQFSTVPNAETDATASEWEDWLPGAVTASTTYTFNGPISALKISRQSGSGTTRAIIRGQ